MKFFLQIYDGQFADCKDALLTNFYLSLYNGFILQFTIDKLVHGNLFLQPSHVDNVI